MQPTSQEVRPDACGPVRPGFESLVGLPSRELEQLFRSVRWDKSVQLEGHPRGRMLAVPGLDSGLLGKVLASYAAGPLMIWEGKSFRRVLGSDQGEGSNRVWLGRRGTAFGFRTYVTASVVDGQPALAIDYDLAGNPGLVRKVYDELRPVQPGLFLGRGMQRTAQGHKLLVWFALDAQQPDGALTF
jgi:hypothetical protein